MVESKYLVLNHGDSTKMLIQLRPNMVDFKRYKFGNLKVKSTLKLSPATNPSKYKHSFEGQDTRLGFRQLVSQKQKEVGESEKYVV